MNLGEKILGMFIDLPLTDKERIFFVNREKELRKMENTGRFMHSSIYGIAGETGSGKTTLFNLMEFPDKEIQKISISISEKETKEVIIADLLHKLCDKVLREKRFSDSRHYAKETMDFLEQEEIKSRQRSIKVGKIVEGGSKWSAQAMARYNLSSIKNRLEKLVHLLTSKGKIVLCVDEIDKERQKDVIIILDSLKEILKSKNLLSFIALPQVMYKEYTMDRYRFFKEENLENILKDIIPVEKMKDDDIKEMLNKRTRTFPGVLPLNVKDLLIEFADGNSREALLLCQNAILSKEIGRTYTEKDFILTVGEIKNEMEKFIEAWVDSLKLSAREGQILKIISDKAVLSRAEFLRLVLKKSKIPRSTLNKTIESLLEKKVLLKEKRNSYQIDRKVKLHYKYFFW